MAGQIARPCATGSWRVITARPCSTSWACSPPCCAATETAASRRCGDVRGRLAHDRRHAGRTECPRHAPGTGRRWPVYPSSLTAAAADGRFVAVSSATWEEVFSALERLGRPRSAEATHARQEMVRLVGAPSRGGGERPAPGRAVSEYRALDRRRGPGTASVESRQSRATR